MKINLSEMMRIKSRLADINTDMDNIFNSVSGEFNDISQNIRSYALQRSILKFQESVTALSKNMSTNMTALEKFMGDQLSTYTITNEEVEQSLKNLVNTIETNFGEKDNNVVQDTVMTEVQANYSPGPVSNTDVTEMTQKSNVNPPMEQHITRAGGVFNGPSGKETYYNLKMDGVVNIMRNQGFSEAEYPYWVRDDGAKMLGDYVMVAADLNTRPRGSIVETSLGTAIVCDTGGFAQNNPTQVDIAVNW